MSYYDEITLIRLRLGRWRGLDTGAAGGEGQAQGAARGKTWGNTWGQTWGQTSGKAARRMRQKRKPHPRFKQKVESGTGDD